MRNTFFRFCSIVLLMTFASLGCSTVSRPKASAEDCSVKVGLQLQKASSLSAGRYTMLLDALQRSTVDEARNDIDYWLDMSIVELEFLEETHPNTRWDETPIKELDQMNVNMRKIYGDIARYRLDHPRKHMISLDANQKRLIDAFVEKYK